MFDWLKELVAWLKEELIPVTVIDEYSRGVRLRWGKADRDEEGKYVILEPGLHWRWPFRDNILTVSVVATTVDLTEQTVTTWNSVQLVIECSVKYKVINAGKLLLEAQNPVDALADMSKGIIRRAIATKEWPSINNLYFEDEIKKLIDKEAKQWGLKCVAFNIATLAPMRSIRLLQTYAYKSNEQKP